MSYVSAETFALGDFNFRFVSSDRAVLDGARKLYASTAQRAGCKLFDLDSIESRVNPADPATIFHALITEAYQYHDGHLYIDGCVFFTGDSELILIAGASHVGKTTLTVAAAQRLGWKICSEDLVLIDSHLSRIVPIVHPLSLRIGALELIEEATGIQPPGLYLNRWLNCRDMFHTAAMKPEFSRAILIASNEPDSGAFCVTAADSHEFVRALLSLSNALYMDSGLEMLSSCVGNGQCYVVNGGSVRQRLDLLAKLAGGCD